MKSSYSLVDLFSTKNIIGWLTNHLLFGLYEEDPISEKHGILAALMTDKAVLEKREQIINSLEKLSVEKMKSLVKKAIDEDRELDLSDIEIQN